MPILNMVWWWKKWGNIWEPLNLTVTTSWLDATITWEDNEIWTIPPTTFQKSELVRKIGSAPTSPSDWTLVVTETVKDMYKTVWYVDQWLTDWETYYYRVFSYSDLGGISYCDAVSVTVSSQWQPWVNTIAYYKFDGNLNDETGNTTAIIVAGSANYANDWDGESFNANAQNAIKTTIPPSTFSSAFTISFWLKLNSVPSMFRICWWIGSGWNWDYMNIQYESWNWWLQVYNNARTSWTWTPTTWTWCNMVIVWWWTANDLKAYLNWVEMTKTNNSYDYVVSSAISIGICCNNGYQGIFGEILPWLMDSFIVESVAWTWTDATNYYNQTKWDYWIS